MSVDSYNLLFAALALVIGFCAAYFPQKIKNGSKIAVLHEKNSELTNRLELLKNESFSAKKSHENAMEIVLREKESLLVHLSKKEADFDNLWENHKAQKLEMEQLQQKFSKEFENLAQKIFEEKSTKFTLQNQENIKMLLNPLQEKIQFFEKKVDETHKESIIYHTSLREQIFNLKEMNLQMSQETLNLTKALKGDSKMRGSWGELILERVLEKSGLTKGQEYEVQQSVTSDDGSRFFPDVIINLPDGKKIVIDSKVSLISYEKYVNDEDESLRTQHLKEHINSVKRHVEQLSSKNYSSLYSMQSPGFVLLFIAIEPAFALALSEEATLYNHAFEKNIVIVTPSTLLATLRTIDSMWTNQKQQQNAYEIARQAGSLYDKFEGFVSDLSKLGKKLSDAQAEYDNAFQKLHLGKGNLISSVERLKKMGAKSKKSLPEHLLTKSNDTFDNVE